MVTRLVVLSTLFTYCYLTVDTLVVNLAGFPRVRRLSFLLRMASALVLAELAGSSL